VGMTGLLFLAMRGAMPPAAADLLQRIAMAGSADDATAVARSIEIYGHGTFTQIVAQRVRDLEALYQIGLFSIPTIFAMFLLGVWAGRRGIFSDPAGSRPLFKKIVLWGLVIGGIGNLGSVLARDLSGGELWADFIGEAAHALTAPVLMLGYVATIALLMTAPSWRRLTPLAAVGRMALTNYLFQSLVRSDTWMSDYLGMAPDVAREVGRQAWLLDLALLRRYLGKIQYELQVYRDPLNSARNASAYVSILGQITGYSYPAQAFLDDVDPWLYVADYLRAWVGEAQLSDYLTSHYGNRWYKQLQAGRLFKELWRSGVKTDAEAMLSELGYTPFDITPLATGYKGL